MVLKKSGMETYLEEHGISSIDKDSLEEIKYQLTIKLIIIDDIDRLFDKEIKSIFQLVKSITDFPKMIYMLSFYKKW